MALRLYNTLTRTKEEFVPIDPRNVRMYVCGPTVYDFAHIGNARPLIVFDVLFRLLKHLYPGPGTAADGSRVTYVRNITDVDDKINARAAEEYPGLPLNEAIRKVTEKTEKQFFSDVAALGCLDPTFQPRATEYISRPDQPEDMIRLIARLIEKKNAYVAEGHVLFHVPSMPDYGRLSNRTLDEMVAGARVEVAPYKRDAMDFVLWKPAKPGEPAWPSPWGAGRPGWHIECSAMAGALLGETFDIHGGGVDLIFPHHENEIAQSRCAHGTPVMARYWLHNGFLQVEGEKMSKSLGNFVTIRDVLQDWPGEVARLAMLGTHYRQPINWTLKSLDEAAKTLSVWTDAASDDAETRPADTVVEALSDDLNTPKVIAELHALRGRAGHKALGGSLAFLGLAGGSLAEWRERHAPSLAVAAEEVDRLILSRAAARKARNFAEADRIRAELDAMGVALKDAKDPATGELVTTWEVKR
ncbi:MAG TPA: cysteine--tRNA ligase [Bauldia sp.]|nr:cysteine--tRNA ligase [Bauldia sp.]